MLERLDIFLLDNVFQKIADRFQEYTGKSCFWLAKVCLIPLPAFILCQYVMGLRAFYPGDPFLVGGGVLLTIAWDRDDRATADFKAERVMNQRRLYLPHGLMRNVILVLGSLNGILMMFLTVTSLSFPRPMEGALHFPYIAAFYFASCTPKPKSPLRAGHRLAWSPI